MGIGEAITKFFHDMGILELRIRNEHPAYAKLSYNSITGMKYYIN